MTFQKWVYRISRDYLSLQVFPDMRCHREVMSLRVKCTYAEMEPYACNWCGELNDLLKVRDVISDLNA